MEIHFRRKCLGITRVRNLTDARSGQGPAYRIRAVIRPAGRLGTTAAGLDEENKARQQARAELTEAVQKKGASVDRYNSILQSTRASRDRPKTMMALRNSALRAPERRRPLMTEMRVSDGGHPPSSQ
jgi:hypothetical protein